MDELIFLKLGGALITDKTVPYTPRLDSLERLAREIGSVLNANRALRLIISHGSGSFGHYAVKESLAPYPYRPSDGKGAQNYWHGVAEV